MVYRPWSVLQIRHSKFEIRNCSEAIGHGQSRTTTDHGPQTMRTVSESIPEPHAPCPAPRALLPSSLACASVLRLTVLYICRHTGESRYPGSPVLSQPSSDPGPRLPPG